MGCAYFAPCPEHGEAGRGVLYDRRRGSAASRGYDRDWSKFAVRYMDKLWWLKVPRAGLCGCRHPTAPKTNDSVCAREGVILLATVVDHIIPIRGKEDPLRFDLANLQALCDRCHNQKRQRESEQAKRRA